MTRKYSSLLFYATVIPAIKRRTKSTALIASSLVLIHCSAAAQQGVPVSISSTTANVQSGAVTPSRYGINTAGTAPAINRSVGLNTSKCLNTSSLTNQGTSIVTPVLYQEIVQKLKTSPTVKLDLYVMSQCPFAVMAEEAVAKLLQEFGNRIELKLSFIAEEKVLSGKNTIISMHGNQEVAEDLRQLVIARDYPDKLMAYLTARAGNYQNDNWQLAANKAGISTAAVGINAAKPESQQLLRGNIRQAQAMSIGASPTLAINGGVFNGPIFNPSGPSASAAACQTGTDPFTGSPYVVCTADANTAWISGSGGTYHAAYICNSLGYGTVSNYGGTCGATCGYCNSANSCVNAPASTTFDHSGNAGSDAHGQILSYTVQWQCGAPCAAPAFTSPAGNQSATTPSNGCSAIVNYTSAASASPSYSYVFTGVTTGSGSGTGSGSVFNKGVTHVVVTAVNSCGSATDNFNITLTDNVPPTITAPAPVTVNGWCQNVPAGSVTLGNPTLGDNCASNSVLLANLTNNAPASFPVGNTTVIWTVTDGNGNSNMASQLVTVNAGTVTSTAAITPLYPMSGQEVQTIYLGYPGCASSIDFSVTGSGGTGSYNYSWTRSNCNGSMMSSIGGTSNTTTFTPVMNDVCSGNNDNVYTFTGLITDTHGCTSTQTRKLNVVNPFAGNDVQLCHKVAVRGASVTQLLTVTPAQVSVHLSHGDILGNCTLFNGSKLINPDDDQVATVYPNPTTGVFVLELSSVREEANIVITDVQGRIIVTKTLAKTDVPTATFDLGQFAVGLYLVQVRDGAFTYRTKLVKQ